ncbi:MAG: metal-dependent transcriptional regulator [Clostridiales bacterium]|nr:metal-dependent transcriptional regulator [Clostridiales bacterium]
MSLQESGEMYLESIYMLTKSKGAVRSIDIVEYMNYSKPSVSRAVKLLKNGEFILIDEHGYITLTESGKEIAEKIVERHTLISSFLISLGVNETTASEDACKIEHVISDESFDAIKRYAEKVANSKNKE